MEALIYNESPIAEYLEADADAHAEAFFESTDPDNRPPQQPPQTPSPRPRSSSSSSSAAHQLQQSFAPRGLPRLRERLRTLRQTAAAVTDVANEEALERFRYTVVASQLLSDEPKARARRPRAPTRDDDHVVGQRAFSVRGAVATAGVSFLIAWFLHLLQWRWHSAIWSPLHWSEICTYIILLGAGCLVLFYFARRQYLDFVRRSAGVTLGKVVSNSHNYDIIVAEGLRFIQEVEVVSRGYEISHPLPPISRLEDQCSPPRCRELRATLGVILRDGILRSVDAHHAIQPLVRDLDLRRYHDIYEVSLEDYTDAVVFAHASPVGAQDSLKELRFLFRLHLTTRKVFLCDLLALHSGSTWHNIHQWRTTTQILADLDLSIARATQELHTAVVQEEFGESLPGRSTDAADNPAEQDVEASTPQKRHARAQMRRFDAVANSIRSLNAKIHLIREEINSSSNSDEDSSLSMAIAGHYEHLGAEIRNALVEWEKGRNTMFLNDGTDPEHRFSRASSGVRSPGSPSPSSLGGLTVVDGGPAEALRLLSGDERASYDGAGPDEEVFEAVALPRKRMSWTPMSREEKLNRLQEERKKRATLQEQAENTTSMLRELQMVIKHRPSPRSDTRITSI